MDYRNKDHEIGIVIMNYMTRPIKFTNKNIGEIVTIDNNDHASDDA